MKEIEGGVTAPLGFTANGIHAGVRRDGDAGRKDLALIVAERECAAAAVYTMNRVKAAPLYVTMAHLEDGKARAVVVNSGNANACAPQSHENAERMARSAAAQLNLRPEDVVVASTGVIGETLPIDVIEGAMPELAAGLNRRGSSDAARAIMTTDTVPKEAARRVEIGGKTVTLGGIAKGSGMIHPNLGTMLCFVTTDAAISPQILREVLRDVARRTFNRVTIDGDTSTNDMCVVLADGLAGNDRIEGAGEDCEAFRSALLALCTDLARRIAADGEGAGRLITCSVSGARSEEAAEQLGKAVVGSSLVKAALFGADANWGRVICAMGYSGAPFRPEDVTIGFRSAAGELTVCRGGEGVPFDEELARAVLSQGEVEIFVALNEGDGEASCWGCDLTYDYVRINGEYRT